MKHKKMWVGLILAGIALTIVFVVEQFVQPGYWLKSLAKILSFTSAVGIYCLIFKVDLLETIRLKKTNNLKPVVLTMSIFLIGTLMLIFLFKNALDFDAIRQSLIEKEKLTKDNCLFVFAYIIVCNSFLEESFFRGFVYCLFDNKKIGAMVSSILFSLYHIGIFVTWFSPWIFALCLIGLIGVGYFLQVLSQKYNSILPNYITHACANIAINIIGLMLIFEIL